MLVELLEVRVGAGQLALVLVGGACQREDREAREEDQTPLYIGVSSPGRGCPPPSVC